MIIRAQVPSSKKGRKLMRSVPRTLTGEMLAVTRTFGRAGQPGVATISAHYRPRIKPDVK